jgi:hypothetical protein
MKKYLIRFLKCLLVIVCMPIWYIAAIICALFIGTVGSLILFIIFYEKTGNTDNSWNKTDNIINVICNFMFIESTEKIKEFLNN